MQHKLIENVPLANIRAWEKNYRDISGENLQKLKNKITELGVFKPLLAIAGAEDGIYQVIGGNQRLRAYRELGFTSADLLFFPNLTDKKIITKIAIADNESDGYTVPEKLKLLFEEAELTLPEMESYALPAEDGVSIADLLAEPEADTDMDPADEVLPVDENAAARVCAGDLILLGRHRLVCGDSTNPETIAFLMNGDQADIVITDPPYGMKLKTDFSRMGKSKKYAGGEVKAVSKNYKPVIGDGDDFTDALITSVFSNFSYCDEIFAFGPDYYHALLPSGGTWLVWDKRHGVEDADFCTAPYEFIFSKIKHRKEFFRVLWFGLCGLQNEPERKRCHPTQKPVRLIRQMLEKYAEEKNNVADPYAGSGSTLIACELMGKTCFTAELDPQYCDVVVRRYAALRGNTEDISVIRNGRKLGYSEIFGEA